MSAWAEIADGRNWGNGADLRDTKEISATGLDERWNGGWKR